MAAELRIDFGSGAVAHRLKFGGGRGQDLPKAIGMKNGRNPEILDATAGLGRDSFLMASLGAKVTMVERSEQMHGLLADALRRGAGESLELAKIIARMTLVFGDAIDVLAHCSPDVVLVDPMHPPRVNSALVKQEMRQIREIVGIDADAPHLMQTALKSAKNRVVLKWPRRAAAMEGIRAPSHQILGKSTRYDVFMI